MRRTSQRVFFLRQFGRAACATLVLSALGLAQTSAVSRPKVLMQNLRLHGFEPPTATASPGKVMLVVHNQTGRPTLTYHVTSPQSLAVSLLGALSADVLSTGTKPTGTMLLNLSTGTYTITEAAEPKWVCTLTVK